MTRKLLLLCAALTFIWIPISAQVKKTAPAGKPSAATSSTAAKPAPASSQTLLDINTASKDQLQALPGIADSYSQAIIKNRPYKAKNELVSRKVVPQATYSKISAMIIAKQPK